MQPLTPVSQDHEGMKVTTPADMLNALTALMALPDYQTGSISVQKGSDGNLTWQLQFTDPSTGQQYAWATYWIVVNTTISTAEYIPDSVFPTKFDPPSA